MCQGRTCTLLGLLGITLHLSQVNQATGEVHSAQRWGQFPKHRHFCWIHLEGHGLVVGGGIIGVHKWKEVTIGLWGHRVGVCSLEYWEANLKAALVQM